MALTEGQVNARRDRLTAFLDAWGDLVATDTGRETNRRLLEFSLECPGLDLPAEIKVRYREYLDRGRDGGWTIEKYTYEYLDVARSKRLAYHLHDIGSVRGVPHAHCEDARMLPNGAAGERAHQLRAIELDLREAHDEFMTWWASDRSPDCSRFRPIEISRE